MIKNLEIMKTYTSQKLDSLYKGNLKNKRIGDITYYLDKLINSEYAVCKDENCLGVFDDYIAALNFYKLQVK